MDFWSIGFKEQISYSRELINCKREDRIGNGGRARHLAIGGAHGVTRPTLNASDPELSPFHAQLIDSIQHELNRHRGKEQAHNADSDVHCNWSRPTGSSRGT